MLCKCGCGKEIILKPFHKYHGIPEYINGHYGKTNEFKENRRRLDADPNSKYNSKEYHQKIGQGGKNRINTDEYREKLRLSKLGDKNPNFEKIPKHLKDIHKNWKRRDPEGYMQHQRKAGKKGFRACSKISNLELRFLRILKKLDIEFTAQFDFNLGFADILIKPNLIIFIDGDFWHGNPIKFKQLSQKQIAQKMKDEGQNVYLKLKGFKVIRIWEYSLKDLNDKEIENLILNVIVPEVATMKEGSK